LPEFPSGSQAEYPDDPIYRVRLSEAWSQAGKANWSSRRHEQAKAALRAAAQVADRLAERYTISGRRTHGPDFLARERG
jgi:hypothetical protein